MADVIGVESLTKQYGDLVAVDDISFSVQQGEVFGILGPNGAGKTTTLECIEGLLTPTAGSISVLGMDIAEDAERIKSRIGVQLQASAYFDYLTLREILDLFALIYRSSASPGDLLAAVGLEDKVDTTVAKLSGGQQQRFTIAATLVNDPELLFSRRADRRTRSEGQARPVGLRPDREPPGADHRDYHPLHGGGGVSCATGSLSWTAGR